MKFTQKSLWHLTSEEGYTVSKSIVNENTIYTAWSPSEKKPLGYRGSAKAAQDLCEYDKRNKNAAK